jgi:HlyD family secretion protein
MNSAPPSRVRRSIRNHLIGGSIVMLLVGFGVGGWAVSTEISGAVIAQGLVVVESNVKKIQHPTGGVVAELRAKNGDRVRAGDLLVRLDDTTTRANLAVVVKALDELAARQTRLEAERDGAEKLSFPDLLTGRMSDPEVARIVNGESRLFELRSIARAGQKAQLKERIAQLDQEIAGLAAQEVSKDREIVLVKREVESLRELWAKNLTPLFRMTASEREAAKLDGERGNLIANIARAKGRITETEFQIIQIDQDLRSEVARELRELQAKSAELVERKVAAEDLLKRIDIRAPQDGTVFQVTVHTVGGVINPAEPIMQIVPDSDTLTVEAKVNGQDIEQLRVGQTAHLRMSAFNQRTTPELEGKISVISADLVVDQRTGLGQYLVRIAIPDEQTVRLGELKLVPGMPVEAFMQTRPRTVISYLAKPITDQLARTFREK